MREQRVVRIDAPPTYDTPPTVDDLFREAGRNHQLEHAFHAEHSAARHAQRETDRQRRNEVAEAFLEGSAAAADASADAQPTTVSIWTPRTAALMFDAGAMTDRRALVPPEAYRRFRADLRCRKRGGDRRLPHRSRRTRSRNRRSPTGSPQYGTPQQQARQAAGVLPMEEVIEAMADQAFAAGDGFERYPMRRRGAPPAAAPAIAAVRARRCRTQLT